MDDFKATVARDKLNARHSRRLAKKNEQFAPPVSFATKELSREEIRKLREKQYLEANFPDVESAYEKNVRCGK